MKQKLTIAKSKISYEMDYFVNDEMYIIMSLTIVFLVGFFSFIIKFN